MAIPFIDFRPAQVMRNKEVYVCYYVLDPTNDRLKRMRIRCNRIKNRREQLKYAVLLCSEINRKLYNGWNPLTGEDTAAKRRVSIVEAATKFVRQKEKELRRDSVRSYRSKLSFFTKWCDKAGISDWLCGRFTAGHAAKILEEYSGGGRSTYAFNSMLQFLKSLFRSFVSDGLASHNPFAAFKGKPGMRPYTTKNLFAVWQRMREELSMPDSYHFYSLKDTGITEMLESGMPSKFVKDLAGHHSLTMTERYLHISDAKRILKTNKIRF